VVGWIGLAEVASNGRLLLGQYKSLSSMNILFS
jgi:hypothetical protein